MQDIGIVSSRAPTVDRPTSARYVYLTFEGLRESRTISDKHTRIRIALPLPEAARLGEMLAALSDQDARDVAI
jgi:hypothetical protein